MFTGPVGLFDGVGDDAEVGQAVDEVLRGEGDQQQTHDADQDADAGLAQQADDLVGVSEDEVAGGGGDDDGDEDGGHLPARLRLAHQHHHGGDGPGAGQHGHAEGDDSGV